MKYQVSDGLREMASDLPTYASTQTSTGITGPDGWLVPPITQDCTRCALCDGVIEEHTEVTLTDSNAYHLMTEHGYRMDGSNADDPIEEDSYVGS